MCIENVESIESVFSCAYYLTKRTAQDNRKKKKRERERKLHTFRLVWRNPFVLFLALLEAPLLLRQGMARLLVIVVGILGPNHE